MGHQVSLWCKLPKMEKQTRTDSKGYNAEGWIVLIFLFFLPVQFFTLFTLLCALRSISWAPLHLQLLVVFGQWEVMKWRAMGNWLLLYFLCLLSAELRFHGSCVSSLDQHLLSLMATTKTPWNSLRIVLPPTPPPKPLASPWDLQHSLLLLLTYFTPL